MQSLMEIASLTGAGGISLKRKKKADLRLDRPEIAHDSSSSTLHKMTTKTTAGDIVQACFSRERTPPREICADTDEMEMEMSTVMKITDRRKLSPNVDIQTAAEIEDFFSAAEKEEQMKFMNKYNFDVVKDVPLAGRYEWIRIKPY